MTISFVSTAGVCAWAPRLYAVTPTTISANVSANIRFRLVSIAKTSHIDCFRQCRPDRAEIYSLETFWNTCEANEVLSGNYPAGNRKQLCVVKKLRNRSDE